MKKTLTLLLLVILFLSSCASIRGYRQKYDIWFPGKAAQQGKTPCNIFPKPLYKN